MNSSDKLSTSDKKKSGSGQNAEPNFQGGQNAAPTFKGGQNAEPTTK